MRPSLGPPGLSAVGLGADLGDGPLGIWRAVPSPVPVAAPRAQSSLQHHLSIYDAFSRLCEQVFLKPNQLE